MKVVFAVLCLLLTFQVTFSQSVTGIVKDDEGKALAGASIALKKSADSSIVKIAVTTAAGQFTFTEVPSDKYFINTSFVGFNVHNSDVFATNGSAVKLEPIMLSRISSDLKEVTVTATRPIIEVKADKMVLNVEGTINAVGQDALELLRK